jgi:hypothetical protein
MKLQNNFVLGLLALTAAAGMVSCSSDEPAGSVNNDSTEAISLDTYVARTRAAVQTDTLLKANGFGVFAYYDEGKAYASSSSSFLAAAANFMNDQSVTYTEKDGWTYTPVRYWSKTSTDCYQFIAYAPLSATITKTAAPVLSYDATDSNFDFMTAVNKDQTKPADKTVPFTFKHRLSRLGFIAKTKSTYSATTASEGAVIKITSATLKGASLKGTYALTSEFTTTNLGWSDVSTADYTVLASSATAKELSTSNTNLIASNEYLFAIPATSADLELDITYTITQGSVTYNESAKLEKKAQAIEMGKAYNFVVTIALDQIDFTLTQVEGWGNATEFSQEY